MIIIKDLYLLFGTRTLFDEISLALQEDQKIGLVGRNGSGKSTMLKVLAGQQAYDKGSVSIERGKKLAYMPQESVLVSEKNVYDEAFTAFAEVLALKKTLEELEVKIEQHATEDLIERYAALQSDYTKINIVSLETQTKKVLKGLGFSDEALEKPVSELSVGWKMRLVLAQLLLQDADFYLFDEPTNHLDIVAKDWFLSFLKASNFGYLLVSHDRYFLDHACDHIIELDRGKAKSYYANYTTYLEQKTHDAELKERAYVQQQKEIKQKTAVIERFKASASRAAMAQSMLKKLDSLERVERDKPPGSLGFSFAATTRPGRIVLQVESVSKVFGQKTIFKNVSFQIERGQKIALIAANGVGKTTLLSIIMGKCVQDSGEITFGYNVTTALFEQDQERSLNRKKTILEEVEDSWGSGDARSKVRSMLGAFLFSGDDVKKRIEVLSGGEKNRVAMTKVLLAPANFLVLDEPTNHLDLQSKDILLSALQQYEGTMLFVSHDRNFLDALATHIVELTPTGVHCFEGSYEAYLYQKSCMAEKIDKESSGSKVEQVKVQAIMTKGQGKADYEARKRRSSLEKKIAKLEQERTMLQESRSATEWGSNERNTLEERLKIVVKQLELSSAEWEKLS